MPWKSRSVVSKIRPWFAKQTVKMAIRSSRVASFIKCVPFRLETNDALRVAMFPQRWKILTWRMANYIHGFSTFFITLTFLVAIRQKSLNEELILHSLYNIAVSFGYLFMVTLYQKPNTCVQMLNQHDFIVKTFAGHGRRSRHWASFNYPILTVFYFAMATVVLWLLFSVNFIWKPRSSQFLYGYLPEASKLTLRSSYVLCLLYEQSVASWTCGILCSFFCYWAADIYIVSSMITSIKKRSKFTQDDVILYGYIQMFLIIFNYFNGTIFTTGFNFMITLTSVVFIYFTIIATQINIIFYTILPCIAFFGVNIICYFMPQGAKIRFQSTKLILTMRAKGVANDECNRMSVSSSSLGRFSGSERFVMEKKLLALSPLRIQIWFFGALAWACLKSLIM